MRTVLNRIMAGWTRRRRAAFRDADALIARFGSASPAEARALASFYRHDGSEAHAWKVVRAVEKRLGIDWCPDTATRYVDDRRSGLNY